MKVGGRQVEVALALALAGWSLEGRAGGGSRLHVCPGGVWWCPSGGEQGPAVSRHGARPTRPRQAPWTNPQQMQQLVPNLCKRLSSRKRWEEKTVARNESWSPGLSWTS